MNILKHTILFDKGGLSIDLSQDIKIHHELILSNQKKIEIELNKIQIGLEIVRQLNQL